MRTFLAVLKDSFRESVDNKIFLVLAGLCLLIVLIILIVIGFEDMTVEETIENTFEGMENTFQERMGMSMLGQMVDTSGPAPELITIKKEPGEKWDVYVVLFRHDDPAIFRYHEGEIQGYKGTERNLVGDSGLRLYILEVFSMAGFRRPTIRGGVDEGTYVLRLRPGRKLEMKGAMQITIFFGIWKFPLKGFTAKSLVQIFEVMLAKYVGGWFGVLVAVLMTAWFVPSMLKKGTIDLLLANPVSRVNILLAKYVGGLSFVFLNATLLIGGSWLAFALKSGYWHPGYLGSILTITFLFAILYSVSTLVGVLFQNSILSILITILFWGMCFLVNVGHTIVNRTPMLSAEVPQAVKKMFDVVHMIMPNTSDMGDLGHYLMTRGSQPLDKVGRIQEQALDKIDFTGEIVSSIIFIAVVLGLAYLAFRRKEF
jgi:ABC-type transport system involved in multi-copper enzyme maturation permease subunit